MRQKHAIAVVSIIEAVFRKISRTSHTIKELTISTENATTFKNSFIYVLVSWITRKYGMKIRKILHTEVQSGKCVAGAIFAVHMRHCHSCVAETAWDIVTSKELVVSLRYNGGTVNSISELIEIDRTAEEILKWKAAIERVRQSASWESI